MAATRGSAWLACAFCMLLAGSTCQAQYELIDSPMYHNPELPRASVVPLFPEDAKDLWLKAFERPEVDLRCQAADAIGFAHRRGAKGFESTIGPLRAAFEKPDQHPALMLAIARTLVTLEARDTAATLLEHAESGSSDLREIVEPALAKWDFRPARELWLKRLADPACPRRNLVLAIQGLGAVGEDKAADRLRELALGDQVPVQIRLEAAQALAMLRSDGLEKDAEALAGDATPRGITSRLVAAALLRRHRSAEAVRLLQRLAQDKEPTVAAAAAGRLLEIDAELLLPALNQLLASPDDKLRSFGVEVLYRKPGERHVHLLADRLEDANPEIRNKARRYLQELGSKAEFRDAVIAEGTRVLGSTKWAGLEQATILLTILDHKPAAERLVELLKFERPEVFITAAWGLRRLAVAETLPDVTKHVEAQFQHILTAPWSSLADPDFRLVEHQVSQLNQLLGQQKYLPAEPLLRKFVPRRAGRLIDEARASAIWALGLIHEGKPDAGLAKALEGRLNAPPMPPGEDIRVRLMCGIALGRMGAKESVPGLREYYSDDRATGDALHDGCGWALEQITGEKMGPPDTIRYVERDWFLMPHKEEPGQASPFVPARAP